MFNKSSSSVNLGKFQN